MFVWGFLQAIIRVRFPDNHTLETTFHPSETVQSLIDVLTKVIALPEQPFYICRHISIYLRLDLNDIWCLEFVPTFIA